MKELKQANQLFRGLMKSLDEGGQAVPKPTFADVYGVNKGLSIGRVSGGPDIKEGSSSEKGGPGSGFFSPEHKGIPGKRGGSLPAGGPREERIKRAKRFAKKKKIDDQFHYITPNGILRHTFARLGKEGKKHEQVKLLQVDAESYIQLHRSPESYKKFKDMPADVKATLVQIAERTSMLEGMRKDLLKEASKAIKKKDWDRAYTALLKVNGIQREVRGHVARRTDVVRRWGNAIGSELHLPSTEDYRGFFTSKHAPKSSAIQKIESTDKWLKVMSSAAVMEAPRIPIKTGEEMAEYGDEARMMNEMATSSYVVARGTSARAQKVKGVPSKVGLLRTANYVTMLGKRHAGIAAKFMERDKKRGAVARGEEEKSLTLVIELNKELKPPPVSKLDTTGVDPEVAASYDYVWDMADVLFPEVPGRDERAQLLMGINEIWSDAMKKKAA